MTHDDFLCNESGTRVHSLNPDLPRISSSFRHVSLQGSILAGNSCALLGYARYWYNTLEIAAGDTNRILAVQGIPKNKPVTVVVDEDMA